MQMQESRIKSVEGPEDLPEDQYKQHGQGKVTFKVKQPAEQVQPTPTSKPKGNGAGKADAVKGRML
jgi:hypothetical protein